MKIVYRKTAELQPYENNPRRNKASVEYVANSIKNFGFKTPIVIDKNNVIVAGHTRYLAAEELGLKEIPCIIAEDLTEDEIRAFRLVDNKTAEYALWDFDLLDKELTELADFNMESFGFTFNISVEEKLDIGDFKERNTETDTFNFTLNFPMEKRELIENFVKENGKTALANEALRIMQEDAEYA